MQYKIVKNKVKIMIEIILITLNISLGIIAKSSFTYYYFSKTYMSEFLINLSNSFLLINIVTIILLIYLLISLFLNKVIKKYHFTIIQIISIITLITSVSINLTIGYKSFFKTECIIGGNSMSPTIYNEEEVVLNFRKKVLRNNVIIFEVNSKNFDIEFSMSQYYIKRIIGLPGDKIKYINNKLYLNDCLVEEGYLSDESFSELTNDFVGIFKYKENGCIIETNIIPDGYCFVMGDNRKVDNNGKNQSYDSRELGLVPISCILGVVEY